MNPGLVNDGSYNYFSYYAETPRIDERSRTAGEGRQCLSVNGTAILRTEL